MTNDSFQLAIAYESAKHSPDPRTQNGSYLLSTPRNGTRGVIGRNCAVKGTSFDWHTPEKYEQIHHAEEHAILVASGQGVPTWGATLYVPWYACMRCARAIVGAKIARVVGHHDLITWAEDLNPAWVDTIAEADRMLDAAGVVRDYLTGPIDASPIRHSGYLWNPRTLEATDL